MKRFGIDFDDPMEEIKTINQTGSVREYHPAFERSLIRVNLSEENNFSCYIGGLTIEWNIAVKITKPSPLSKVYKIARMLDAYLLSMRQYPTNHSPIIAKRFADQKYSRSKGILPKPYSTNSSFSKGLNRRTLSSQEMNGKKGKSLVLFLP